MFVLKILIKMKESSIKLNELPLLKADDLLLISEKNKDN